MESRLHKAGRQLLFKTVRQCCLCKTVGRSDVHKAVLQVPSQYTASPSEGDSRGDGSGSRVGTGTGTGRGRGSLPAETESFASRLGAMCVAARGAVAAVPSLQPISTLTLKHTNTQTHKHTTRVRWAGISQWEAEER